LAWFFGLINLRGGTPVLETRLSQSVYMFAVAIGAVACLLTSLFGVWSA